MSDPIKYFETKLKAMSLGELQAYKKRLDESIKQKISNILEHEIKTRTTS